MKEKIVNDLKKDLINIKSNSEIGKILYDKSIESGSFKIFIPALEDVEELFKDIVHHLEIYSSTCKEICKKHYGNSYGEIEDTYNDEEDETIFGRGSIEVVKDNNKLKIVLECE